MRFMVAGSIDEVVGLVRRELGASGRTQKQMAEHLGFSQKHVSQMMTGKNGISLSNLFEMCTYLGMSVAIIPNGSKGES